MTLLNRAEYVQKYTDYVLNTSVEQHFAPFKRGFLDVIDNGFFTLLEADEIMKMVCADTNLDFDELKQGARYDHLFLILNLKFIKQRVGPRSLKF